MNNTIELLKKEISNLKRDLKYHEEQVFIKELMIEKLEHSLKILGVDDE